jgi:DNA-directed RNA polymerase subunit RPC12/RpoP
MENNQIKELIDIANNLTVEKAAELLGPQSVQEGFYTCKTCGKKVNRSDIIIIEDPIVGHATDPICAECKAEFDKMKVSTIVCIGCKEVIARVEPKKYTTGFEMKAGHIYHIADCPVCNPEKFSDPNKPTPSKIIEEQIYNQKFSKKVN